MLEVYTQIEINELVEAGLKPKIPIGKILDQEQGALSKNDIKALASFCTAKRFNAGEILINVGDMTSHAYLIIQGMLSTCEDENINQLFKIGDLVGKISKNTNAIQNSTIICVTNGIALEIGYKQLEEMVLKYPNLGFKFANEYKDNIEVTSIVSDYEPEEDIEEDLKDEDI